jgi:hypothetical protein
LEDDRLLEEAGSKYQDTGASNGCSITPGESGMLRRQRLCYCGERHLLFLSFLAALAGASIRFLAEHSNHAKLGSYRQRVSPALKMGVQKMIVRHRRLNRTRTSYRPTRIRVCTNDFNSVLLSPISVGLYNGQEVIVVLPGLLYPKSSTWMQSNSGGQCLK